MLHAGSKVGVFGRKEASINPAVCFGDSPEGINGVIFAKFDSAPA
jgi:hypothetical protein